jgi:hypothetical protein
MFGAILGRIDIPIFDWGKGLDWMPGFRAGARARAGNSKGELLLVLSAAVLPAPARMRSGVEKNLRPLKCPERYSGGSIFRFSIGERDLIGCRGFEHEHEHEHEQETRKGNSCSCSNEVTSGEKLVAVEMFGAILGRIDIPIFDWGKGLD